MGFAVLRGSELLDYGVRKLRNGSRVYDAMGQARSCVLDLVGRYSPDELAIEEPLLIPTKRAALVSAIAQEFHERAKELGTPVTELSPRKVREILIHQSTGSKLDVAEALVRSFSELRPLAPTRPRRAVLGLASRDRYWLHAFDAIALAVVVQILKRTSGPVPAVPTI